MSDTFASPAKEEVSRAYVPVVDRLTVVNEITSLTPDAAGIMAAYGLHCSGCSVGGMESLADGCAMHGFDDETVDALIEDLNDAVRARPPRPQTIGVTESAARALEGVARSQGKDACALGVVPDGHGGFCMEFADEAPVGDARFFHDDFPHIVVFASPAVLWRVGGATIDHRDERFKLDLPEDALPTGCACGGDCGCK